MKDDSAPPSGGVGSSRWKELIEVASPISGRELDLRTEIVPLVMTTEEREGERGRERERERGGGRGGSPRVLFVFSS